MTIGKLIEHHRRRQIPKMTQGRLGKEVDSDGDYIGRIERGVVSPRWDFGLKVLEHLGVDTTHSLMDY